MTEQTNRRSVREVDPNVLSGLRVPVYILRALEEGMTEQQLIMKFGIRDGQLLHLWLSFMLHNHWLQKDNEGKWFTTDRGKLWEEKYSL